MKRPPYPWAVTAATRGASPAPARRRRARWLLPAALSGAIALGGWLPTVAASGPHLRPQTVDQLVGRLEEPEVAAFSGTLQSRADLGLPAPAGGAGAGFSLTGFLSGTQRMKVWDAGAGRRLALIGQGSELDLYQYGNQAWLYDSVSNTATRLRPAPSGASPLPAVGAGRLVSGLLAGASAGTAFSQGRPLYVDGRPAYLLDLAPRPGSRQAAQSTVGRIAVAIDADTGAVLRVTITAKGAATPSFSVGFTSVRFYGSPRSLSPSSFRFAPPPGATVASGGALGVGALLGGGRLLGRGWSAVTVLPGAGRDLPADARDASVAVRGPFGAARLLSTGLVNLLLLPDGDVAAGLVTPQALESAVGGR